MIVLQGHQIIFGNLCVGRICVLHVDLAALERGIAEGVIDPNDVLQSQAVMLRERAPSVLPIKELVRESNLQLRMIA